MAVSMFATVPTTDMLAVLLFVTETPAVEEWIVPCRTDAVKLTLPAPESTSETRIRFEPAVLNTRGVSSLNVCAPGRAGVQGEAVAAKQGASLTPTTVMVTV